MKNKKAEQLLISFLILPWSKLQSLDQVIAVQYLYTESKSLENTLYVLEVHNQITCLLL
jgi:hypothetical protein